MLYNHTSTLQSFAFFFNAYDNYFVMLFVSEQDNCGKIANKSGMNVNMINHHSDKTWRGSGMNNLTKGHIRGGRNTATLIPCINFVLLKHFFLVNRVNFSFLVHYCLLDSIFLLAGLKYFSLSQQKLSCLCPCLILLARSSSFVLSFISCHRSLTPLIKSWVITLKTSIITSRSTSFEK